MSPAASSPPGPCHTAHPPARRGWVTRVLGAALLLPLGLLSGCSRPEPGAPIGAASAPAQVPAKAPAPSAGSQPADGPVATPMEVIAALPPAAALTSAPSPALADAAPAAPNPSVAPPGPPLPPAVAAFKKQRDACDHFRGEEPYDKQRAAFLKAQLAKACTGSDRALAALRKRFAQNPEAIAALKDYEDRIE